MKNNKNLIIKILCIIFPLVIVVGFSAWVIIYETVVKPMASFSEFYGIEQRVVYNGKEQWPQILDNSNLPFEEDELVYQYKLEGQSKYAEGKPTDAGIYDFLISIPEKGDCQVKFIIEKATPIIDKKPTAAPTDMYEGEEIKFTGGSFLGINNELLDGSCDTSSINSNSVKFTVGGNSKSTSNFTLTWVPRDNKNYNSVYLDYTVTINAVCKINSTYYGTIEDALDKATNGQTIYVLVDDKMLSAGYPIITNNCAIKSGTTLTLPFNDTTYNGRVTGSQKTADFNDGAAGSADFADENAKAVQTNRKVSVKIANDVTLTIENGANLNIGGIIGHEDTNTSGHTSGKYCEIVMGNNSKIICNGGTIDCMGYIKEESTNNSSIVIANSGIVKMPFVIYDYSGGTNTVGSYTGESGSILNASKFKQADGSKGVSPFNIYDMPNVQAKFQIYSTAQLIGYADLYIATSTTHYTTDVKIIGASNSLINLENEGYAEIKYSSNNSDGFTINYRAGYGNNEKTGVTNIKLYGGASSGTMQLSISMKVAGSIGADVTVSTENVFFPISWKYNLELYNGYYNITNKLKFLPGSTLTVSSDATLNISADTSFYSDYNDTRGVSTKYPSNKRAAELIVNGTCNISSAFGGLISTKQNSNEAILAFLPGHTLQVLRKEGYADGGANNITPHFIDLGNETSKGNIDGTLKDFSEDTSSTDFWFVSNNQTWTRAIGYEKYTITYDANEGTFGSSSTKEMEYPFKGSSTDRYTIKAFNVSTQKRDGYKFVGWYLDKDGVTSALNYSIGANENLTVYAKWEIEDYEIFYEIEYKDGSSKTNLINNNVTTYNINSTINLVDAEDNDFIFSGWFLNETYSLDFKAKNSYTGLELLTLSKELNYPDGTFYFYSYFTDLTEYKYRIVTGNVNIDEKEGIVKEGNTLFNELNDFNQQFETYKTMISYSEYFVGWYTTANHESGTEFSIESKIDDTNTKDGIISLYAYWIPKDNSVTYKWHYKNGISGSINSTDFNETYYYLNDAEVNISPENLTNNSNYKIEGYTFGEQWSDESDGELFNPNDINIQNLLSKNKRNIKLNATVEVNKYTINVIVNGSIAKTTIKFGSTSQTIKSNNSFEVEYNINVIISIDDYYDGLVFHDTPTNCQIDGVSGKYFSNKNKDSQWASGTSSNDFYMPSKSVTITFTKT